MLAVAKKERASCVRACALNRDPFMFTRFSYAGREAAGSRKVSNGNIGFDAVRAGEHSPVDGQTVG